MRRALLVILTLGLSGLYGTANAACPDILNHAPRKLHSEQTLDLCQYSGKVILAVNTASQCGYTPQFKGLEALYQRYKDEGLVVLGFPSDDFRQEFGNEEKTAGVCYINYGVTFPVLATSKVKGNGANPVFVVLNEAKGAPSWNFNKYLISKDGAVLEHFPAQTKPDDTALIDAIERAINAAQ